MRKRFFLYLLILIITSITVFGLISTWHTKVMIDDILQNNKKDVVYQIENKIQTYDKILYFIELEIVRKGEYVIQDISEDIDKLGSKTEISKDNLKQLTEKYKIDEIYLIDKNGTVFNTTFEPDSGLNLFSISPDFKEFLKTVYKSNKVSSSRLTTSEKTGLINTYIYYHPKGWDCYLEISVGLKNFVKSNYSQEYYKFLIEEYFTSIIQQNLYLHNLDIYQINEIGKWSLINEGREFKKSREFYNELKEKKEIVEKDGYKYTIYKLLDFDRANFDWSFGQYVELSYDFSILKKYYTRVQIFIVITALLIIVIFYSIFSFLFNKIS